MNRATFTMIAAICVFVSCLELRAQPPAYVDFEPDAADVLTRGPVHEAFAEPIVFDPEPGPIVRTPPPSPIDEMPPDERPAGNYVTWIPGYWSWDDDINDYIWVSGIWRDIPPGREWVPGYWGRTSQGFQWVSGFWSDIDGAQTVYLPEPPIYNETRPPTAPSPDVIWVPGAWVWQQQQYAWRPGYWLPGRADWVWVPAHYIWTPRGYIFVDGYWDYDVDRRGLVFAPVRFERRVYTRPHFRYSPRSVIDVRVFSDHLFVRANLGHYFFGDYYDDKYSHAGYRPWYSTYSSKRVYDPIYVHRRWEHRNDHDWDSHLRRDFAYRHDHQDARPPRTWAEQRSRHDDRGRPESGIAAIANTILDLAGNKRGRTRYEKVDDKERHQLFERTQQIQNLLGSRKQNESRTDGKVDQRFWQRTRPAHVNRSRSPIALKVITEFARDKLPPKPEPPKFDGKIVPQHRDHRNDRHDDKKQDDRKRDDKKRDDKKDDKKSQDRGKGRP